MYFQTIIAVNYFIKWSRIIYQIFAKISKWIDHILQNTLVVNNIVLIIHFYVPFIGI